MERKLSQYQHLGRGRQSIITPMITGKGLARLQRLRADSALVPANNREEAIVNITNSYRQRVANTVAKLKKPGPLEAAIAASQRFAAAVKAKAKPAIEVDQEALQRVQQGQDLLRQPQQEK